MPTKTKKTKSKSAKPKSFLSKLGPGIITGASDDDPSGIGTYSSAGAAYGFSLLWMALYTFPLMAAVQYMCAKLGMVTGRGLAGIIRQHYSKGLGLAAVILLLVANIINIGADLGAIGAAINLLFKGIPIIYAVVPSAIFVLLLQMFGSYKLFTNVLKVLALSLLAYIATAFFTHVNWLDVLQHSFLPEFKWDSKNLQMIVAILGTTISPYLFFWQATNEVEKDKEEGKKTIKDRQGASREELSDAALDVNIGMILSNLVMFFIILTTAATLFKTGQTDIQSADQAAKALAPLAGPAASILFALGLIGTGFLTIPILSGSAAYALSEVLAWKSDIDANVNKAPAFYTVIGLSTLIGMGLNFVHINPMVALVWTAIINGVLAPPLLVMILLVSNDKKIMGDKANGKLLNILGVVTTLLMTAAAVAMIIAMCGKPS